MVSTEDKKFGQTIEAFSCDGLQNHRRHLHSHWLQANLSEVEGKIKVMVSIIEEDGDSFAQRAEMYYKRRPHLLILLDDLHRCYLCLAEKYYQICGSHSARLIPTCSSSFTCINSSSTASHSNASALAVPIGRHIGISEYVMQQVVSMDQVPSKRLCIYNSKENLLETPQTAVFEREIMKRLVV